MNPFYRDAPELLARAEAQLQARQRRISQGGSRRPLFVVGGLAGGAIIVALIALAVGLSRGASNTLGAPVAAQPWSSALPVTLAMTVAEATVRPKGSPPGNSAVMSTT